MGVLKFFFALMICVEIIFGAVFFSKGDMSASAIIFMVATGMFILLAFAAYVAGKSEEA